MINCSKNLNKHKHNKLILIGLHAIRKKKSTTISKKLSYNEHKLKIHVSTLLLQLTSTPLFKKEILCIWFLSWNLYLTKHKDSTKIVLTHTQTQIHIRTKSNQTLNKFKYVTDRKSTRLNSSHRNTSRMPSSA